MKCVCKKRETPCKLFIYKGFLTYLVAGAGLEPTTFGL